MWQVYEVKVIVLTWGDLTDTESASERGRNKVYREKSAEVIVLSRKCERRKTHGLAALCHKVERRIRMEACCPKRFVEKRMKSTGRAEREEVSGK